MAALESEHGDKELDKMETNTNDISKELEQQKTVLTLESILMISILDILASCLKVLWYFELCSSVCPTYIRELIHGRYSMGECHGFTVMVELFLSFGFASWIDS